MAKISIFKVESKLYRQSAISLKKLFVSHPTRSCAVVDLFTPIICHVIQREYRNDVDAGSKVNYPIPKLVQKT